MKRDTGLCRSDETEVLVGWRFVPETTRLDQVRFAKDGLLTPNVSNTEAIKGKRSGLVCRCIWRLGICHTKYAPSSSHKGAHPNKYEPLYRCRFK